MFQAFHRTLGVAIGEHLGYLFTGLWTMLLGIAMTQSAVFDAWLGWPGVALGIWPKHERAGVWDVSLS